MCKILAQSNQYHAKYAAFFIFFVLEHLQNRRLQLQYLRTMKINSVCKMEPKGLFQYLVARYYHLYYLACSNGELPINVSKDVQNPPPPPPPGEIGLDIRG